MRVILCRGLPASGKTTWAKQYVRDNPGTIRFNNDEFSYMTTGWDDARSFEPMNSRYLREARLLAIKYAVASGADLVLDNTNLSPRTVQEAEEIVRCHGTVEVVDFPVDWSECVRRNIARGEPIPNRVIDRMAQQYRDTYDWIQRGT